MGIAGLLKLIKDLVVKGHMKAFSGTVIGIDAMRWLLLDAMANRPFSYTLKMLAMLKMYKIRPVFVLDG
jgi:hypothetical protein